jgi:hypothetical protein
MSFFEPTLHYFEDGYAQVFRGRNLLCEFCEQIQVLVVVAREYLRVDEPIKIDEIADHAGLMIDLATYADFEHVVMAVAKGVIALSVGRAIFLLRHFFAMQAVRR